MTSKAVLESLQENCRTCGYERGDHRGRDGACPKPGKRAGQYHPEKKFDGEQTGVHWP